MFTERSGIIVWVSDLKAAGKNLEKYGNVHFISKRLHYAAMYVYSSRLDETVKQLQKLPYVKKVERSYRNEIKTEYTSNVPDKTRFYSL
ncbi:YlbG family protein [Paenibacillus tyrfis]|uniref:YlbG family protein n=1 Tax=Paenibacillus tyrfis TaxID=1501230 RepID=UPI000B5968B3|nr:YlbG family protein [Paenibacillus tyrfis]